MTQVTEIDKRLFQQVCWSADGYEPTPAQRTFLDDPSRLKLVAGGIRAGKSKSTARDFDGETLTPKGLIWIVGPDYEQGKAEWEYLFQPLHRLGKVVKYSAPEKGSRSFETPWGCRVQTKSSDELMALASFAPTAILVVEAGQQPYEVLQKSLERALEHDAKVTLSGTFEGALSWYVAMFEKWQGPNPESGRSFSIPTWTNTHRFPGGRQDPKILNLERALPTELFMERCGAVPYKPSGLVFRAFDHARHVRRIDFNPALPLEIAVDPAQHTYVVLAIQWEPDKHPTPVYVVDEIYEHDTLAQNVIPLVMERPWWKHVKANAGVIDTAGKQHQGSLSQVEIWRDMTGKALRSNYVFIADSVDVVNLRLQKTFDDAGVTRPLLQFDYRLRSDKDYAGRANGILAELGLYKWREWREGRHSVSKPVDSNNDALKALGYWLYDQFGPVVERKHGTKKVRRAYWY